jgi:hypothetical protein
MNWRIGGIWGKILLETIYEPWRSGKCLRLRGERYKPYQERE